MVSSPEIIRVIVDTLGKYNPKNLVVDPVMISKSGYSLLKPEAKENLVKYLIPKAYILTPNTLEAEEIAGIKINNLDDMKLVGEKILGLGPNYVLMKGGHLDGDAIDVLIGKDTFETYKSERLDMKNTHGTGCTLSSAITAYLALGLDVKEAVLEAKKYITNAIKYSFDIGKGVGPVHHFYKFDLNK
ncbi:phosphomethylpyrimidine kinase [[Clostridium] sordellii ATCC 9714]|nr:phosphomethylpyrimidine kinase [[Clostridium] sordellii ATCC 9714] [Paeniclostridium sordellii ATCC 9714]